MKRPFCPCRPDCKKRNATCHTWCEAYGVYETGMREFYEEREKAWRGKLAADAVIRRGFDVVMHRKGGHKGKPSKGGGHEQ